MIRISGNMNWPTAFVTLVIWFSVVGGWVFGIAVAKGFWLTFGAVCLPPLAWVLAVQWLVERFA